MILDGPVLDLKTFLLLIAIVTGPAIIGIVLIIGARWALRGRGGTVTVARVGMASMVAAYVMTVVGTIVMASVDFVDEYDLYGYMINWACTCMATAWAAIIVTAVYCWYRPWRLP